MNPSRLIFVFGMLFALHVLALSAPARASGAAIGPFCLDGVTAKEHPEHASVTADGVWTPTEFKLDPAYAPVNRVPACIINGGFGSKADAVIS